MGTGGVGRYRLWRLSVPKITIRLSVAVVFSTVLVASGCSSRTAPAPVTKLYTGKTFEDFESNSLHTDSYTVEKGETLYSIAFRANTDVRELAQLNNLSEPYTIFPGQSLTLPDSDSRRRTGDRSSSLASSSSNKNANSQSQNALSKPVAKPSHKEYVANKGNQKSIKKQPHKSAVSLPESAQEPQIRNADIEWQWPTENAILEGFSLAERGNKGINFAGQRGDAVKAAAAGKVVYVGSALRGFGRLIILKHNDDYITAYAHNEELLVKEQQWVDVGQTIATMGDSDAQRVQLHFELRFRGKSVNPKRYLP